MTIDGVNSEYCSAQNPPGSEAPLCVPGVFPMGF